MTWHSSLALNFDYVATRQKTRLCHRQHEGALMIQRPLYPEPEPQAGICHIYVLYPPAGIADGDFLNLTFSLQANSHAVITTPGAGKWYGHRRVKTDNAHNLSQSHELDPKLSAKLPPKPYPKYRLNAYLSYGSSIAINNANQTIHASLDKHTILEWLPQESIYYDNSFSDAFNRFDLADSASLLTWDIAVFGRKAFEENFTTGHYHNRLQIWRDEQLLVSEHTNQAANSRWFGSVLALNGHHVHGSFWAVPSLATVEAIQSTSTKSSAIRDSTLQLTQYLDQTIGEIRALIDEQHLPVDCTHNYQAINCRYLGGDVRACFEAFYQIRELLRANWYELKPHRPRIWDT